MTDNNDLIELTFTDLKSNVNNIIANSVPVWRKNKSGELVILPLDRIEQFIGGDRLSSVIFYISSKWQNVIIKGTEKKETSSKTDRLAFLNNSTGAGTYTEFRKTVSSFSFDERENHFREILELIQEYDTEGASIEEGMMTDVIDAVSVAFLLSKTSFEEYYNDSTNVSSDHIKTTAKNVTALVQGIISILKKSRAANNFINLLGQKSTGSTIDHMYSVFMIFIPFCNFYNSFFAKGKIAKIRGEFKTGFLRYYQRLTLARHPESLEDVFMGGMREISTDKLLQAGIGALLHDIGKIDNIDYFESSNKYDRKIIVRHAPVSYNMIVKTREFDTDVSILAALHHEYYNDPSGYGISRILFPEDNRKFRVPQHCLAYDLADVKNGLCMAYVPVKMLEIVDVFDALIDNKRKYRENEFTVDEALRIMKTEFIEKKTKIDPILFSIFLEFIGSHSILKDSSLISNLSFR